MALTHYDVYCWDLKDVHGWIEVESPDKLFKSVLDFADAFIISESWAYTTKDIFRVFPATIRLNSPITYKSLMDFGPVNRYHRLPVFYWEVLDFMFDNNQNLVVLSTASSRTVQIEEVRL